MGIPMPPPWVILSIALGFSKNLQNIKDVAGLGFSIVTGNGEEAGCSLCDKLVTIVLEQVELDDMSEGGGIDCPSICFGIGKCVDNCEKITGAMANSTGYPCVAAGLCPEVDEFGEVSCKWSYKKIGCEPATSCDRHFPNKCELKSSLKRWKRMNNLIGDNIGALGGALSSRKKCSEAGADPKFCIREASGLGYIAEWACLLMVLVGGAIFSVRAIETPGGDDDRQWLTFWIIFFVVSVVERLADVTLSQFSRYYELKLLAFAWLMWGNGADKIYRSARGLLRRIARIFPRLFAALWREPTADEYLATLPTVLQRAVAERGYEAVFGELTSEADVRRIYDESTLWQLNSLWNELDPRYLELTLISAEGIPSMDANGLADAYGVAYLVPPVEPEAAPPAVTGALMAALSRTPSTASILEEVEVTPAMKRTLSQQELAAALARQKLMGAVLKVQTYTRGRYWRRQARRGSARPAPITWREVLAAARAGELRTAAELTLSLAKTLRAEMKRFSAAVSGGPVGAKEQYGRVRSRVIKRSLTPKWNQRLEMRLRGGQLNDRGEYDNKEAPFTGLRLELWDSDTITRDDYFGEVSIRTLCPLMDGRTHVYTLKLSDPEGKFDQPVQGSVTFSLKYES